MRHINGPKFPAVAFNLAPPSNMTWQGECGVGCKADYKLPIHVIETMLKTAPSVKDAYKFTGSSNGHVFGSLSEALCKMGCPAAMGTCMLLTGQLWFVHYTDIGAYMKLVAIAKAQVKETAASGRLPGVKG